MFVTDVTERKKSLPTWGIALVIIVATYILMRFVGGLPSTLVSFYMLFMIAGSVIHISLRDDDIKEFNEAVDFLLTGRDRGKKAGTAELKSIIRIAILIVIPLLAAAFVYGKVNVSLAPPAAIFTPHPTPPEWVVSLQVPQWAADPNKWEKERLAAGKLIYEDNCLPCHGEHSDGKGPMAAAIKYPTSPSNFKEPGTIAQLPMSYVFWRVRDGGIFDKQFKSAMPGWGNELSEEEIWEVIMYAYTNAGVKPRTWD